MASSSYQCYEEIVSQADSWREAANEVDGKASDILQFFKRHQPTDILIVGCGSPFYLGESLQLSWQAALGVRCRVAPASELVLYPDAYLPPDLSSSPVLVVISRSGTTTETIWAVEAFQQQYSGRTLLISCAPDSPLDDRADISILIPGAHEKTVPQTRSFAAMALAAHMLGSLVAGDDALLDLLRSAVPHATRIIETFEPVAQEIGSQPVDHAFYMGSGPLYGIAREGALKMTEMSITTCSAYPFMEARHGPRSVIEEHTLLAGLLGQGAREHEARVMADFVGTSQPVSVALVPDADWETGDARYTIPVGVCWPDAIQGLAYLPVMHLMAYYRAVAKGVNPDTSRNLSIYVDLTGA